MTVIQMPVAADLPPPADPAAAMQRFRTALAELLEAYAPIAASADLAVIDQLAAECLLEQRRQLMTMGDLPAANLARAVGTDLAALATDIEVDLAQPPPDGGGEDEAEGIAA